MNPDLIIQLRDFIDSLKSMKREKVLEVACGYGYVTDEILCDYFCEVHMFDQCTNAIDHVVTKFENEPKITSKTKRTMQSFEWDDEWNCIVFRYCVGYLEDEELKEVLIKAQKCLKGRVSTDKRGATQESYIIIQDQVCSEHEIVETQKDQRVRSQKQLEKIYKDAQLTISKDPNALTMKKNYFPVMIWSLY